MMVAEQLIDGRVIEACQQGDRDAFQLLFETYKDKVFSIAVYSSDGDRALPADIHQTLFSEFVHCLSPVSRRFRVYDLALPACGQCLSRRKAPPPQIVAVGRD